MIARLIPSLCLLCAVSLSAALLIGRLLLPLPHASLLTRNSCALPCLFGVIPGVSSRDEATPQLERLQVSYSYYNPIGRTYPMHESTHPLSLMMYLSFGDPFIGDVRALHLYEMSGAQNLGYLGDFLAAGYQPAHVFAACQNNQHVIITLTDQNTFLEIALNAELMPTSPVLQVSTASDPDAQARSMVDFVCAAETPWLGFAAAWKYQAVF